MVGAVWINAGRIWEALVLKAFVVEVAKDAGETVNACYCCSPACWAPAKSRHLQRYGATERHVAGVSLIAFAGPCLAQVRGLLIACFVAQAQ